MQQFCPPQGTKVCYNASVPHQRNRTIFDIGSEARVPVGFEISFLGHRPEVSVGSRVPRDRACGNGQTQQRIGFVVKPLTFHNERPDTVVRRVTSTRRALPSCFSLRFLAAPTTRHDFEGAPLFFRAGAAISKVRCGKKEIMSGSEKKLRWLLPVAVPLSSTKF